MTETRRALMIAAIPALAVALFIAAFGTNVPFWDEWELAGVIEKLARHQATFEHFFAPQSEHRFVAAKLILAPLALATHWNVIVELWLSFAIAVAGYIGLLRLLRGADTARIVVSSLAWFSIAAYENWLWGWQLSWFLTNALFVWAVVAASNRRIATAAVLCFVATFSAAYGIAAWLALAPFFRRRALAVWLMLFGGTLAVYLYRFHPTPGGSATRSPFVWIAYVLAVLGSPLARVSWVAVIAGAMLLVVLIRSPKQPWLSIGLFAIGFAMMNAIGRSALGLPQALTSRYLTPASLLLIAVVNLYAFRRIVHIAIAAALIVQSLTSIPFGRQIKRSRDEARVCLALLLVNDSSDCTAPLAASNATLRTGAMAMDRIGILKLVKDSDFETSTVRGKVDTVTWPPTVHVRGYVELPAEGLYVVGATLEGTHRIVAANIVRGPGRAEWFLDIPPRLSPAGKMFQVWIFTPADGKLRPLQFGRFSPFERHPTRLNRPFPL